MSCSDEVGKSVEIAIYFLTDVINIWARISSSYWHMRSEKRLSVVNELRKRACGAVHVSEAMLLGPGGECKASIVFATGGEKRDIVCSDHFSQFPRGEYSQSGQR